MTMLACIPLLRPPPALKLSPELFRGELGLKSGIKILAKQPERPESTSAIVTFAEAQCGCKDGSHTVGWALEYSCSGVLTPARPPQRPWASQLSPPT